MSDIDMTPLDKHTEEQWQLGQKIENDLRKIIRDRVYVDDAFLKQFSVIAGESGDEAYSVLMYMLCRKRFSVSDAQQHWKSILALYDEMTEKLDIKGPVDIRLALVHYFLHSNDSIERPSLIDLSVFDKIQQSVYQDELTSLFNYRYLKGHLDQELQRAKRYGSVVSLILLDVDDFKYYNDNFGHEEGNRVLILLAKILQDSIRRMDTAVRYGGEEFCLILPATNKSGSLVVFERIQDSLHRAEIEHAREQPKGFVSVSAGVATFPADASTADDLVRCADNAMYIAKNQGKDRMHIYGDDRRSHQRIMMQLNGYFVFGDPDQKFPLTTIDISEGGLMIATDKSVPAGALLDVQVNLHGAGRPVGFPARVLRCDTAEDSSCIIGLSIVEMPSRDRARLHAFVSEQITGE